MSFRAGDVVKHHPSGEEWVLACDEENGYVTPAGWPESRAAALDCTLIEAASDESRFEMLTNASRISGYRGSLARTQLHEGTGEPSR